MPCAIFLFTNKDKVERRTGTVRFFGLTGAFLLLYTGENGWKRGDNMRTVYKNGTVYTGNDFAEDFAVENGKFCFVGETDKATADEVVDLDGKFV